MATKTTSEILPLTPREQKLAVALLGRSRRQYAEYLAECEEDRRNGYRPHYCRHGVSMWVDYDCACGMCEDEGNYWDYLTEMNHARNTVYAAKRTMGERVDALVRISVLGGDISPLTEWASEPMNRLTALVA